MKTMKKLRFANSVLVILLLIFNSSCSVFQSAKKAVTSYDEEGTKFLQAKEYAKAIESFSKAIEVDPYYIKAYYGRGKALTESKQ